MAGAPLRCLAGAKAGRSTDSMWTAMRLLTVLALLAGAWRSYKSMGTAVRAGGRRYWRGPDGLYRRWYGGRGHGPETLGLPAPDAD